MLYTAVIVPKVEINDNNNNRHIYRGPHMPTEGAGEVSVRRSGDSY